MFPCDLKTIGTKVHCFTSSCFFEAVEYTEFFPGLPRDCFLFEIAAQFVYKSLYLVWLNVNTCRQESLLLVKSKKALC